MAMANSMFVMQIAARFYANSSELLAEYLEDDEEYRSTENPTKYCLSTNPLAVIKILAGDGAACKSHLRVNIKAFQHIVQCLPRKQHGWSREIEAVVFLFWLAAGCSYRVVSVSMTIPTTKVFRITTKALKALLEMIPTIIKLPTEEELQAISAGFANSGQSSISRQAAGAIDGTYVNVLCPPRLHDVYINRKLRYAIQLQLLCDHNGKILNMFTGYPGSVHDQRVFRNSPLYLQALYPPAGYFILGDSGYKCATTPIAIATPFKGTNLARSQTLFNKHHSLARNCVERCIGSVKNRWRYLFADRPIELKLEKAVQVIAVCCALHNICVTNGDILEDDIEASPAQRLENDNNNEDISAVEFRDRLCAELMHEVYQR